MSKQVSEVADTVEEFSKVTDDIKNFPSKKDMSKLEDNLVDEVKSSKKLTKSGINKLGEVANRNLKYSEAIYEDLHDI
jgi:hypothetical protein